MQVRIKRDVPIQGKNYTADQVVDFKPALAAALIHQKLAEAVAPSTDPATSKKKGN